MMANRLIDDGQYRQVAGDRFLVTGDSGALTFGDMRHMCQVSCCRPEHNNVGSIISQSYSLLVI